MPKPRTGLPKTHPKRMEVEKRRQRAVSLRVSGLSYVEIATKMREEGHGAKYDRKMAFDDVDMVLQRTIDENNETAAGQRQVELQRLDRCVASLMQRIKDGEPSAVSAFVRVSDRRAKLLGLDAAIEVKVTKEVQEQVNAEWSAFFEGLSADKRVPEHIKDIVIEIAANAGRKTLERAALQTSNGHPLVEA